MAKKGQKQKKYSAEFKISVILDMLNNNLGYRETVRKYWDTKSRTEESHYRTSHYRTRLKLWERIYLEEGEAGLMAERRGRKGAGRPRKRTLDKAVEEDLIAENQRLKEELEYAQIEIEYLKKLDALVRAEERKNGKKRK